MRKKLIIIFSFLLISSAFFSQGLSNSKTTQSLKFPTSETVSEGMSRIYILRTTGTLWNYDVSVYLDQKVIGKVGPKSYLMFEVEADKEISIGTAFVGNSVRNKNEENQEFITIKPKLGKTYYVGVKAKYGTFRGQTELSQIEDKDALKMIPKFDKPKVNYIE